MEFLLDYYFFRNWQDSRCKLLLVAFKSVSNPSEVTSVMLRYYDYDSGGIKSL